MCFCYIENQPLPNGVEQSDITIYKKIRENAAKKITELKSLNALTNANIGPTQERCPSAIEIGKWHIETWYSSPFPQIGRSVV